MFAKLIYLVAGLIIFLLAYRWFINQPSKDISRKLKRIGLYGIAAGLIFMALTGRLPLLFAVFAGLIPFAQRAFALFRNYHLFKNLGNQFPNLKGMGGLGGFGGLNQQSNHSPGQNSRIETQFLRMSLDHETGTLSGIVLDGQFKGRRLDELNLNTLLEALTEFHAEDEESATLLETYMDRRFDQDWRTHVHAQGTAHGAEKNSEMSHQEAYQILGIQPNASTDEIRDAHRRLMQKMHPDRGGSTYLASKINKAKDTLLNHVA